MNKLNAETLTEPSSPGTARRRREADATRSRPAGRRGAYLLSPLQSLLLSLCFLLFQLFVFDQDGGLAPGSFPVEDSGHGVRPALAGSHASSRSTAVPAVAGFGLALTVGFCRFVVRRKGVLLWSTDSCRTYEKEQTKLYRWRQRRPRWSPTPHRAGTGCARVAVLDCVREQ